MEKQKDLEIVELMIAMYCRGKHKSKKGELCPDCAELAEYVRQRRERSPFGDDKPFCSNCKIHCYRPDMRAKIAAVMRSSRPRLTFSHPVIAFAPFSETITTKRPAAQANKKKARKTDPEPTGPGFSLSKILFYFLFGSGKKTSNTLQPLGEPNGP